MALEEVVLSFLQSYYGLLAFVAGLAFTDPLIILAALAGAGKANVWIIYGLAVLGEVGHDVLFFYISKSRLIDYIKKKFKLHKKENKIANAIESIPKIKGSYFITLFLAKFLYGVRDSVVLYVGHKEKSFKKYFITCAIATACTLAVVVGLGWLAGRGFTQIIPLFKGFEKGLGLFVLIIVAAYVIYGIIGKVIMKITKRYLRKLNLI